MRRSEKGDRFISPLRHLKQQLLQIRRGDSFLEAQDFNADDLIAGVEVQNDSGLDFLGLDDRGLVEAQLERIGLFVIVHFRMHCDGQI